jgi:hypothetical protein
MRGVRVATCVLGACGVLALAASASPRSGAPRALEIRALHGSLVLLGRWGSDPLYGVRLRATVCEHSPPPGGTYPDFRITHYDVTGPRKRRHWWPLRTVLDRPSWLVPLGESWGGKPCGSLVLEDPIPPEHYTLESLGNPNSCYAAGLTILGSHGQATRRTIVKCGPRFGAGAR